VEYWQVYGPPDGCALDAGKIAYTLIPAGCNDAFIEGLGKPSASLQGPRRQNRSSADQARPLSTQPLLMS